MDTTIINVKGDSENWIENWIATVELPMSDAAWLKCDHPHLWVKDGVCQSCGERLEAAPEMEQEG